MKAIILARVSDKKQDSNEAQVIRISDYIKYRDLTVWKTYEIEESSTKGDREKFQEVVKEIERSKEPIALVVDTVDRLQRSFKESVLLDDLRKRGKLTIHFYRENLVLHKESNSADLLRWDMAVMFARSYVLQLSDNVKRKFEQKRRNGEWIGRAPIGYLNIGEDKNNKDIIPDPKNWVPMPQLVFKNLLTEHIDISFPQLSNIQIIIWCQDRQTVILHKMLHCKFPAIGGLGIYPFHKVPFWTDDRYGTSEWFHTQIIPDRFQFVNVSR